MESHELKYSDESELVRALRKAIGVGDYETVKVTLSQFERIDNQTIKYFPKTKEEYDNLKKVPHELLLDIGLGAWEKGHYLYPAEWYDYIPEGYEVVFIDGRTGKFQRGITDDDRRFGCLPYGFIKEAADGA